MTPKSPSSVSNNSEKIQMMRKKGIGIKHHPGHQVAECRLQSPYSVGHYSRRDRYGLPVFCQTNQFHKFIIIIDRSAARCRFNTAENEKKIDVIIDTDVLGGGNKREITYRGLIMCVTVKMTPKTMQMPPTAT